MDVDDYSPMLFMEQAKVAYKTRKEGSWGGFCVKLAAAILVSALLGWGLPWLSALEEGKLSAQDATAMDMDNYVDWYTEPPEPSVSAARTTPAALPAVQPHLPVLAAAGTAPTATRLLALTVADVYDQLGVPTGALILMFLMAGILRAKERYKLSWEGFERLPLRSRLACRAFSLVTAWRASRAPDYVMGPLLLLATFYTAEWWWLFIATAHFVWVVKRWPARDPICPPGDQGHILHLTLGALQCGRLYARRVAHYVLPWLLPGSWLEPGSLPLTLYTVVYSTVFALLALDLEPVGAKSWRLSSFFVGSEDRSVVPVVYYALFAWMPLSLFSACKQAVAQTPWPGWRWLPLFPWYFVYQMDAPVLLQFATLIMAYPMWWRAVIRKLCYCPKRQGGRLSSLLLFLLHGPKCQPVFPNDFSRPEESSLQLLQKRLGGALTMSHQEIKQDEIAAATHRTVAVVSRFFPALVRQQRKVASWSYVVVRQLYEEIIGPYVLLFYFLHTFPEAQLTLGYKCVFASVTLAPAATVGTIYQTARLAVSHIKGGWACVLHNITAGAQWLGIGPLLQELLEAMATSIAAALGTVLSQAVTTFQSALRAMQAQLTALVKDGSRRRQHQLQQRRQGSSTAYVDDGCLHQLLKPNGGNSGSRHDPASKASLGSARAKGRGKQKKGSSKPTQQPSYAGRAEQTGFQPKMTDWAGSVDATAAQVGLAASRQAVQAVTEVAAGQPTLNTGPASHVPWSGESSKPSMTYASGSSSSSSTALAAQPTQPTPPVECAAGCVSGSGAPSWAGSPVGTKTSPARQTPNKQKQNKQAQEHAKNTEHDSGPWDRQAAAGRAAAGSRPMQAAAAAAAAEEDAGAAPASYPTDHGSADVGELPDPQGWGQGLSTEQLSSLLVAVQESHESLLPAQPGGSLGLEETECLYCTERPPAAVCIPCGHMVFCEPCAQLLYQRGRTACELCRVELEGWWGPTMGQLAVGAAPAGKSSMG